MVKRFLFRLIVQNKDLIINTLKNAYKTYAKNSSTTNTNTNTNQHTNETNKNSTDSNSSNNNQEKQEKHEKQEEKSSFGKFSMQNLISSPMTKQEAIKILDLVNKTDYTSKDIMEKYEKLMQMNSPEKGGSFYIQNKVYYAKEFLMEEYPKEDNISQYNPKI